MYDIILFALFIAQMLIGVPLYAALLMTSLLGLLGTGNLTLLRVIPQQFYGGMDSFTLMALPFFILTGNLMNRSGLTDRLIDFSRLIVGRVRGGLGYVNVVGSVVFAGVNGSASADASALGSILIPAMVKPTRLSLLLVLPVPSLLELFVSFTLSPVLPIGILMYIASLLKAVLPNGVPGINAPLSIIASFPSPTRICFLKSFGVTSLILYLLNPPCGRNTQMALLSVLNPRLKTSKTTTI